jgi:hypothetical protein
MKKRRLTTPEKNRTKKFGDEMHEVRIQNCQKVYEVILAMREASTAQIQKVLEKRKEPLSRRTIERCIEGDDRVIKNKRNYSIDEWSRLETRYLNPLRFRLHIWEAVLLSRPYAYDEASMRKLIEAFGAIIVFVFIEASRPFQDKLKGKGKNMNYKDRNDLVYHWALNSIPFDFMFRTFVSVFNYKLQEGKSMPPALKVTGESREEMTDLQVRECLDMLENNYPDVYQELVNAKNKFYENSIKESLG